MKSFPLVFVLPTVATLVAFVAVERVLPGRGSFVLVVGAMVTTAFATWFAARQPQNSDV
jgi:hypothetical protein